MEAIIELKNVLQKQGEAWEQFKKVNDEVLLKKADGKAVGDLEAKLANISADMDKLQEVKTQFDELMLKMSRPGFSGSDNKDLSEETKNFNLYRRAASKNGNPVSDIDENAYAAYKNAFWNLMRKGNPDMLSSDERKAMSAGTDSEGGYLLPAPSVGRIVKKIHEISPIRQIANVMSISSNVLEGPYDNDEGSCGWVAETGTRSDSATPQVGQWRIEAHEMYAMPKVSQTLLDDAAVNIEAWLGDKVANKIAKTEAAAFITGTGVGQPRGFASYTTAATGDASRTWGQIEHVVTGANGAFHTTQADPLFELIGAFKTAYLANANWVTRREVITAIRKFKTTTTLEYIWQPGLQVGQADKLLGYPIVIAQDIPAIATGSLSMWFGDFREAYQIVDRIGLRTLRDPYTAKPHVVFYTTARVGGGVLNFEAIKAVKFSS